MSFKERDIINLAERWYEKSGSGRKKLARLPIGDDTFIFEPPGGKLVSVTTDSLVEGIHFKMSWTDLFFLGWKSVAINFSDLASSGAKPAFVFINLCLPGKTTFENIERFYEGAFSCSEKYGAVIAGGDISKSDKFSISVTAVGFLTGEDILTRSGALPGMKIYVTGNLGGAATGLLALENSVDGDQYAESIEKFLKPIPRIEIGTSLGKQGIHVCEDISDGLSKEIRNICRKSSCGARIYQSKLPVDNDAVNISKKLKKDLMEIVIGGGEEYELVIVADEKKISNFLQNENAMPMLTEVGEIVERAGGINLVLEDGELVELTGGYSHF